MAREIRQFAFNSGIWDKRLITRTDLDRYHYACLKLDNFDINFTGSLKRRKGFKTVSICSGVHEVDFLRDATGAVYPLPVSVASDYCRATRIFPFYSETKDMFVVLTCWYPSHTSYAPYITCTIHDSATGKRIGTQNSIDLKWQVEDKSMGSDLSSIRCAQSNDELYFVSQYFKPRALIRTWDDSGNVSFMVDTMGIRCPPVKQFGKDCCFTYSGSGTSGTITLSSLDEEANGVKTTFVLGDVLAIKSDLTQTISGKFTITEGKTYARNDWTSDALPAFGKVTLTTSGKWSGKMCIEVSYDGGATWVVASSVWAPQDGTLSPSTSVYIEDFGALVRVSINEVNTVRYTYIKTNDSGNPSGVDYLDLSDSTCYCEWSLTCYGEQTFYYKITGYSVSGSSGNTLCSWTNANINSITVSPIEYSPSSVTGTAYVSCFIGNNNPRTIEIAQQRIWFCGTRTQSKTVWASETDNIDVFKVGTNSTSGLSFTPISTTYDDAVWFKGISNGFAVGCVRSEMTVMPASGGVISSTSITMDAQSSWGSHECDAVVAGDKIFYAKAGGHEIMAQQYSLDSDSYASQSTNLYCRELFENDPVKKLVFSRLPVSSIYVLTESGLIYRFIFNNDENVAAWSKIKLQSNGRLKFKWESDYVAGENYYEVDDIEVMRVGTEDVLFVVVRGYFSYYNEETGKMVTFSPLTYSVLANTSEAVQDEILIRFCRLNNYIYGDAQNMSQFSSFYGVDSALLGGVAEWTSEVQTMPLAVSGDENFGHRCVVAGLDVYGNFGCDFEYSLDGKLWREHKISATRDKESQVHLLWNGGYVDYQHFYLRLTGGNVDDFEISGVGVEIRATT